MLTCSLCLVWYYSPSHISTLQEMTLQKVLWPTKPLVGASFRCCSHTMPVEAALLLEQKGFLKVSLKLRIWKHGRLVSSHVVWGRKKPVFGKNATNFSYSFLCFFLGLTGGTSKVWGRKGEAGKGMLGVDWCTSCWPWSCFPNCPLPSWSFQSLCHISEGTQ